jgi:ABC-type antimicrobial peptide transport system permease subunit
MGPIRQAIEKINGEIVVYDTETMDKIISNSLAAQRFSMILLGIFAALALVLSCVGIYGVISYLVGQRTHEIGIRMALGAEKRDVLGLVIRMGLGLVGGGIVLGVVASLAVARVIATQLWGVSAYDPITLSSVAALLLITGIVACWVPARRASRVDPLVALRYE